MVEKRHILAVGAVALLALCGAALKQRMDAAKKVAFEAERRRIDPFGNLPPEVARAYAQRRRENELAMERAMREGPPKDLAPRLMSLAYSPNGHFIVGDLVSNGAAELVVWWARGNTPVARLKIENASTPLQPTWIANDELRAGDRFYDWRDINGRFQLREQPGASTGIGQVYRGGGTITSVQHFPKQDVTLHVEHDGSDGKGRMRASSYSTGVELPLPDELARTFDYQLETTQPVARWGKAPLRIAQWLDSQWFNDPKVAFGQSRIEVWDARAKRRLWQKTLPDSKGQLFVSQGRYLVAVGTPRLQPNNPNTITYMNGKRVPNPPEYRSDGVDIYEAASGRTLFSTTQKSLVSQNSVLSGDARMLAVLSNESLPNSSRAQTRLTVREVPSGRVKASFPLPALGGKGPAHPWHLQAFSPDGTRVALLRDGDTPQQRAQPFLLNWHASPPQFGRALSY